MKHIGDFKFRPFKECEKLIDSRYSICDRFLPKLTNSMVAESGDGFLIYKPQLSWKRIQVIGNVNPDDLDVDDSCIFYFEDKEPRPLEKCENNEVDFIIDYSEKELHKYKQKNSVDRKMSENGISIEINPAFVFEQEFDILFKKWSNQTKTERKVANHKNWLDNESLSKIAYYKDDKLVGLQMFEESCNSIYFLMNMCDYESMGTSTPLMFSYPIEFFGRKIHFGGAGPKDDRLIQHKNRICHGKYVTFSKIALVSLKKTTSEKREQQLREIIGKLRNVSANCE